MNSGQDVTERRFVLRIWLVASLLMLASVIVIARIGLAANGLFNGKPDGFLAIPLAVILPYATFIYLVRLPGTMTSEGAIMRLAVLVLVILILGMPPFALHLALGFPFAFLVVELFETRFPPRWREAIKHRLVS